MPSKYPFFVLATEIAEDLAMWPICPARVLQINGGDAGTIVADKLPFTSFTILSQEIIQLPSRGYGFHPIDIRLGDWRNVELGDGYEIILCLDFLRQLTDRDRIAFLALAHRSLAIGGRTLAIECVTRADAAALELQNAGRAAGYERVMISSMAADESWSAVVFERDRWSAWHVD